MAKLRILMAVALVILGVLLTRVFVWPLMINDPQYSQVSRERLLKTPDGWTLQFNITNNQNEAASYNICVIVDGKPYQDNFQISPGGVFTYLQHILSKDVTSGEVSVTITQEGEDAPFEQGTYYLS